MKRGRDDADGGEEAHRKREEAWSRLMDACEDGDVVAARRAIDDGANVNVRENGGLEWFPLLYAAHPDLGNSVGIVQMLLGAGAGVNEADINGRTALHLVVLRGGERNMVDALLRGGANPNAAKDNGDTPCHLAETAEVLELLVAAGGDLTRRNEDGETPFQFRGRPNHLRSIHKVWTPHRMLPRWGVTVFPLYVECCPSFRGVIITLLLCFRRFRQMVPSEVAMDTIEYVAEMHRREIWWPLMFDMRPYM